MKYIPSKNYQLVDYRIEVKQFIWMLGERLSRDFAPIVSYGAKRHWKEKEVMVQYAKRG